MASIRCRNGKWYVQVRKKGQILCATFSDRETAELWGKYKEDIIDEIGYFDFKYENTITLNEAIDLKIKDLESKDTDKRSVNDVKSLKDSFSEFSDTPLVNIKSEDIVTKTNVMLDSIIRRGGSKKSNSGKIVVQSPRTVLKKLAVLGSVFSFIIKNGAAIQNPVLTSINQIKKYTNKE